jgi:ankyrin repeat protein
MFRKRTPDQRLFQAAEERSVRAARRAIEIGANVNARDEFTRTALHIASLHGDVSLAAFLISVGADVNSRDGHGNVPLRMCIASPFERSLDLAKMLIAKGANIAARNEDDESLLDAAAAHVRLDIANMLVGAADGHTPRTDASSVDGQQRKQREL